MSDGYTPRNKGTSFSVQSICDVSIIIKSGRKHCSVDLSGHCYHIRGTVDT